MSTTLLEAAIHRFRGTREIDITHLPVPREPLKIQKGISATELGVQLYVTWCSWGHTSGHSVEQAKKTLEELVKLWGNNRDFIRPLQKPLQIEEGQWILTQQGIDQILLDRTPLQLLEIFSRSSLAQERLELLKEATRACLAPRE